MNKMMLSFLGALQDVRELLSGLARYCSYDGLQVLENAGFGMPSFSPLSVEVTHDMYLVATLCCSQDISQPNFHHTDPITEVGRLAVQRVAGAVLHVSGMDARQLTSALATSTVQNILAARHLCLVALQASVGPDNCFRLFRFAELCGIAPLQQAAEQVCLAGLPAGGAAAQDATGFALLHQEQLQSLLQSDDLQVSSELDVFHAIAAWVQAQPQERAPAMAGLVQSCVRLGSMDLAQLEQLDLDPVVLASPDVTRVVARAYVMRIVCINKTSSSGGGAVARPRKSAARAAAAEEGLAAVAGLEAVERGSESMVWAH